jgi:hypothetical protein
MKWVVWALVLIVGAIINLIFDKKKIGYPWMYLWGFLIGGISIIILR